MTEEQLEKERHFDDDCNVISHYYSAKRIHPTIPFYLQDTNGEVFEFGWNLIYEYIINVSENEEW